MSRLQEEKARGPGRVSPPAGRGQSVCLLPGRASSSHHHRRASGGCPQRKYLRFDSVPSAGAAQGYNEAGCLRSPVLLHGAPCDPEPEKQALLQGGRKQAVGPDSRPRA